MEPTSIFVAVAFYAFVGGMGVEAGEKPFPTKEACEAVLPVVKEQLLKQAEANRETAPLKFYGLSCVEVPVEKFKYAPKVDA